MPILSLTPKLHRFGFQNYNTHPAQNDVVLGWVGIVVLEFGVKLTFRYDFLYGMSKLRENQTLIHLSERKPKFDTLK
jgi:hypothetical protein